MVSQTKATDGIVAVWQGEIHHKLIWRVEKAKRSDIENKLDNWETNYKAVAWGGGECGKVSDGCDSRFDRVLNMVIWWNDFDRPSNHHFPAHAPVVSPQSPFIELSRKLQSLIDFGFRYSDWPNFSPNPSLHTIQSSTSRESSRSALHQHGTKKQFKTESEKSSIEMRKPTILSLYYLDQSFCCHLPSCTQTAFQFQAQLINFFAVDVTDFPARNQSCNSVVLTLN